MDWNAAIERNGRALRRILAMLVAMAGARLEERLAREACRVEVPRQCAASPDAEPASLGRAASGGGRDRTPARRSDDRRPPPEGEVEAAFTLPRHRHRAILRLLRPAEAAARRLVIVAARGLAVPPPRPRAARPRPGSIFVAAGRGTGIVLPFGVRPAAVLPGLAGPRPAPRRLALPLFDALRGPQHRPPPGCAPRISVPGLSQRDGERGPPAPGDAIDATRLALRLQALGRALDDLPAQARRFARWRAARAAGTGEAGAPGEPRAAPFRRVSPLRPGRPPGSRRRPAHEVHEVLADLHHFAVAALEQFRQERVEEGADTS